MPSVHLRLPATARPTTRLRRSSSSSLAKAGITVKPNPIEPGQYYGVVFDPEKAHELINAGWGPDWPNASTVIPELFTPTGGFNLSQFDDQAFNDATAKALGRARPCRAGQAVAGPQHRGHEAGRRDPDPLRSRPAHGRLEGRQRVPAGRPTARGRTATCTSAPADQHVTHANAWGRGSAPPPRLARLVSGETPVRRSRSVSRYRKGTALSGYIVRRLLGMIFMLLLLTLVVFLLFSVLPADPARLTCGKACTPEIIEANRLRLGLDLPVLAAVLGVPQGHLRRAHLRLRHPDLRVHRPVPGLLVHPRRGSHRPDQGPLPRDDLPGARRVRPLDHRRRQRRHLRGPAARQVAGQDASWAISLVGYSLPSFFIGLILLFFVILRWQLLPYPSYVPPFEDPVQFFQTMILPWIVLAILYAAFYIRLTRNQMLDTLGEDYIRTARAKGLPERIVIRKHALRAGLTPIVTAAGLDLAGLLGGAIITEAIFSLPGLGALSISVGRRRRPAGDRRHHAGDRDVHHRGQPDRRPAVRRHRPAGEARMTDRPGAHPGASSKSTTSTSSSPPRTASSAPSTASPSPSSAARPSRSWASRARARA